MVRLRVTNFDLELRAKHAGTSSKKFRLSDGARGEGLIRSDTTTPTVDQISVTVKRNHR